MNKLTDRGQESLLLRLVARAVEKEGAEAPKRAADLRAKNADAGDAELIKKLNAQYRRVTVSTGAGAGAAGFVPGVGTVAALGFSTVEAAAFLNLSARYVLTRAILQGMDPGDFDRRRTLVMGVMLGKGGVAAGQQSGRQWAKALTRQRATATGAGALQRGIVRSFLARFLVRKGAGIVGRTLPFGIGAVVGGAANYASSRTVIDGAHDAFGTPA